MGGILWTRGDQRPVYRDDMLDLRVRHWLLPVVIHDVRLIHHMVPFAYNLTINTHILGSEEITLPFKIV